MGWQISSQYNYMHNDAMHHVCCVLLEYFGTCIVRLQAHTSAVYLLWFQCFIQSICTVWYWCCTLVMISMFHSVYLCCVVLMLYTCYGFNVSYSTSVLYDIYAVHLLWFQCFIQYICTVWYWCCTFVMVSMFHTLYMYCVIFMLYTCYGFNVSQSIYFCYVLGCAFPPLTLAGAVNSAHSSLCTGHSGWLQGTR